MVGGGARAEPKARREGTEKGVGLLEDGFVSGMDGWPRAPRAD